MARHPRHQRQRSGIPSAIHCGVPRTRRWAGAATPTQRNTTQAQERARRASDVANISNFTSKNNPPWLLAEPTGPVWPPGPSAPDQATATASRAVSGSRRARFDRTLLIVGRVLLSWLAAIPRRLGDRLFAMNDAEAFWRDWQITRTRGGLARRYRDPRFGTLAECPKCRATGHTGTGHTGAGANGAGHTGAGANGAGANGAGANGAGANGAGANGAGANGAGANGAGRNGAGADGAANLPCVPCLGTGRITLGEVS